MAAVMACSCGGAEPEVVPPTVLEPVADAGVAPVAASRTMLRSAERADWPCAIDTVIADGGPPAKIYIEYAGPAACEIPLELAPEGVIGCPTRFTYLDRGSYYMKDFVYDGKDRLVAAGQTTYAWAGDRVAARVPEGGGSEPYVENAEGVQVMVGDLPERWMRFRGDRLVEVVVPRWQSTTTLTWDAARLIRTDTNWNAQVESKQLRYDCAAAQK
jgi:hypothetical protein